MLPNGRYDTIVVGVGGMGSAAAYHISKRGHHVLAIERFGIPNDVGASHGHTRLIRYAQSDPRYVSLIHRAYELWRSLEAACHEQLLRITGSLEGGLPDGELFAGVHTSIAEAGVPFEILNGDEIRQRFPAYHLPADHMAIFQPGGGFLVPERCVAAHTELARLSGAEIHDHERVLELSPTYNGVRVATDRDAYEASSAVVCMGPWTASLLGFLSPYAIPERQVVAWFEPTKREIFELKRFPVFRLAVEEGRYYGFPIFGIPGFKIGRLHHLKEVCEPDTVERDVRADDESVLREFVERYFPDGAGRTLAASVCMFINTPDHDFIIDRHPGWPQITIAAGFSGHGFKFCSVVGEVIADLVEGRRSQYDLSLFRLGRFRSPAGLV